MYRLAIAFVWIVSVTLVSAGGHAEKPALARDWPPLSAQEYAEHFGWVRETEGGERWNQDAVARVLDEFVKDAETDRSETGLTGPARTNLLVVVSGFLATRGRGEEGTRAGHSLRMALERVAEDERDELGQRYAAFVLGLLSARSREYQRAVTRFEQAVDGVAAGRLRGAILQNLGMVFHVGQDQLRFSGRIEGAFGVPRNRKCTLRLLPCSDEPVYRGYRVRIADGRYQIGNVRPGVYHLGVFPAEAHDGESIALQQVEVKVDPERPTRHDIALPPQVQTISPANGAEIRYVTEGSVAFRWSKIEGIAKPKYCVVVRPAETADGGSKHAIVRTVDDVSCTIKHREFRQGGAYLWQIALLSEVGGYSLTNAVSWSAPVRFALTGFPIRSVH